MIELFKIRATRLPPPQRRDLTPEEEEHWAQVRARLAETRAKGELL